MASKKESASSSRSSTERCCGSAGSGRPHGTDGVFTVSEPDRAPRTARAGRWCWSRGATGGSSRRAAPRSARSCGWRESGTAPRPRRCGARRSRWNAAPRHAGRRRAPGRRPDRARRVGRRAAGRPRAATCCCCPRPTRLEVERPRATRCSSAGARCRSHVDTVPRIDVDIGPAGSP